MPDDLLTPREAAAVVRLQPQTLAKHRCCGTGPRFKKLGRVVRYSLADLQAWLDRNTFSNTAEADLSK